MPTLRKGSWEVGRAGGASIHAHVSVVIGALLWGLASSSHALAYLLLLLGHVGAKWVVAARLGVRVQRVMLTGWGAELELDPAPTGARAAVAWAGPAWQAAMLTVVLVGSAAGWAWAFAPWARSVWLIANGLMMLLGVVPGLPFGGEQLWRVLVDRGGRRSGAGGLPRSWARWVRTRQQSRTESESRPAAARWRRTAPRGGSSNASKAKPVSGAPHPASPAPKSPPAAPASPNPAAASAQDTPEVLPSQQAQRELAELLERIAQEAGKAAKRR